MFNFSFKKLISIFFKLFSICFASSICWRSLIFSFISSLFNKFPSLSSMSLKFKFSLLLFSFFSLFSFTNSSTKSSNSFSSSVLIKFGISNSSLIFILPLSSPYIMLYLLLLFLSKIIIKSLIGISLFSFVLLNWDIFFLFL